MKKKRVVPIFIIIIGLIFSGMVLFANLLGLDSNTSWSRLRILALLACLLVTAIPLFFLFLPNQTDSILNRIKEIPFISNLLGSQTSKILIKYSFLLPIICFVFILYVWFVSSGTWTDWVSPTRYYADLARGFERGNLFMATKPDHRLAEISDPYDPLIRKENDVEILLDASYFQGKYYLYWGPVPALLLVPVQVFYHLRIGDMQLSFVFSCGLFIVLTLFTLFIREKFFDTLPKWTLSVSILLIGTANPIMYMLNNYNSAMVYEVAIIGGQFFMIFGMLIAVSIFEQPFHYWKLILIGFLWTLAIATRLNLLLPVATMCIILVCYWFTKNKGWKWLIKNVLCLAIPLILGGIALGWYNWVRFGSVTESGLYYQLLKGINLQTNTVPLLHPIYIPQNLYNNLFYSFGLDEQFPFTRVRVGYMAPILSFYPLPDIYGAQRITGILVSVPFVLFALIPFVKIASRAYKNNQRNLNSLFWIIVMLGSVFGTAFVFLLFYYFSAMRYLTDFMPSLLILSTIGFWQGYKELEQKPSKQKQYAILSIGIISLSIFFSIVIAVSINDARFEIINWFTKS